MTRPREDPAFRKFRVRLGWALLGALIVGVFIMRPTEREWGAVGGVALLALAMILGASDFRIRRR